MQPTVGFLNRSGYQSTVGIFVILWNMGPNTSFLVPPRVSCLQDVDNSSQILQFVTTHLGVLAGVSSLKFWPGHKKPFPSSFSKTTPPLQCIAMEAKIRCVDTAEKYTITSQTATTQKGKGRIGRSIVLDLIVLDWIVLDWVILDWIVLDWIVLDWIVLARLCKLILVPLPGN